MAMINNWSGTITTGTATTTSGYYTNYGDYYSGYSRSFENYIIGSDPVIKKELSFEAKLQEEIDDWLGIFNE